MSTGIVFLTRSTLLSQSTSQLFIDNGNPGQMPCPVKDANVLAITTVPEPSYSIFAGNIGHAAASLILKQRVALGALIDATKGDYDIPDILPIPDLVTSFEQNLSQQVESFMETRGFRKEASNRQTYYRGPASNTIIADVLTRGGKSDTAAPYGAVNVLGYLTFRTVSRLVFAAIRAFRKPSDNNYAYGCVVNTSPPTFEVTKKHKATFKKASELQMSGLFIPYFEGMNLPDKVSPMDIFSRYFTTSLGSDQDAVCRKLASLRQGWLSLSTTSAGLMLAHLLTCLDMGIRTGARPTIYQVGTYAGCVLEREKSFSILKANTPIHSVELEVLQAAVASFNAHETALVKICGIMSTVKDVDEERPEDIPASFITSARSLHTYIRNRVFSTEQLREIRENVQKLKFSEKLWEPTSQDMLLYAIQHIVEKKELPDSCPIAYKTEAMYTKDPILSTLAAFGLRAPSLLGEKANVSLPITRSGTFYKKKVQEKELEGIPIFLKALQQSAEDWHSLLGRGVISFQVASKPSKKGNARVPGARYYVGFESANSARLQRLLGENLSQAARDTSAKKRRAQDIEDGQEEREQAMKKRIRVGISQNEQLLADFQGLQVEEDDELAMDVSAF